MPRHGRQENLFDIIFSILLIVPIWVGPTLAGGVYIALRFVWPKVFSSHEATTTILRGVGPAVAPWAALAFIVVWVVAELRKRQRRRLLAAQTGLDSIRALSWHEFEHLVGEAYRRQGYLVEETGTGSGDGGIDLILRGHGETVLVQCKQWRSHRVGVKPVRELYGVLASERADRAILATCGTFTDEARAFAQGKPVQLVAAQELLELVRSGQQAQSVSAADVSTPADLPPDSGAAPQNGAAPAMTCPKCGSAMVIRMARKGPNAGTRFWGCTSYPRCRTTSPCRES